MTEGPRGPDGEEAGPELPNLAVRVVQLFVAPGRLFDRLRERPAWLGAILLAVAAGAVTLWVIPEEIVREFFRSQIPAEAPQDAVQRQVDLQYRFRFIHPLLLVPLTIVLTAGVLLFVFNLLLGGEARFKQLFAATAHAFVIPALGGLALVPLKIQTGDFQRSLALHWLVPGMEEGFLYYLLQGMDFFALWGAVVLGIGVSRIYRHRTATVGVSVVAGLYVIVAASGALVRAVIAG